MNSEFQLYQLNSNLIKLISLFLFVLTIGVGIGLIYLSTTSGTKFSGIEEHYNGSNIEVEFDIPEKYPRTLNNLLLTTHNHIISLSLIFIAIGIIFSFNSKKFKWLLCHHF